MTVTHHPINSDYDFFSYPQQRATWVVQRWLWMDLRGGYLFGGPAIGKSRGVEMLKGRLLTRAGEVIPVHIVSHQKVTASTDLKYWKFMAGALGINFRRSIDAVTLRNDLITFLVKEASGNSERRVVIALDEANDATRFHYCLLKGISNELRSSMHRVRLFALSVGSFELKKFVEKLDPKYDRALFHRFFYGYHQQYGLRNVAEVKHLCEFYDRPQPNYHSAQGFVADLHPKLYERGFRLAENAPTLWKAFRKVYPHSEETGWHLAYFKSTVNLILRDLLRDYPDLSSDLAEFAVRQSGLLGPVADKGDDFEPRHAVAA